MGQLKFVASKDSLSEDVWRRAYLIGMDSIPWMSANHRQNNLWVLERDVSESGNLCVPWEVEGFGETLLSTASLMERSEPYRLTLELCRGTVNRLRNQTVDWEMAGLKIPTDLSAKIQHACGTFSRSVALKATDEEQSNTLAEEAIRLALRAIDQLGAEYARQALEFRHRQLPKLSTLLAGSIGLKTPYEGEAAERFTRAFNSVALPVNWRAVEPQIGVYQWDALDHQVQWCLKRKLRICFGPLFHPSPALLPEWLYLWEDDFEQLQSCVAQFLQEIVRRYKGRVLLWHASAQLNVPVALSLSEEERLRLAVRSIEAIRQVDPQTPVVISFDRPWAEFMAHQEVDLSPHHFADALVRSDMGLAGIGLELNLGQGPDSSEPRDLVELSQQLDRWAFLQLPLLVTLTIPSGGSKSAPASPQFATPEAQAAYAERVLPVVLAKQLVHGIIWNQLDDSQPHQPYPCGVFDIAGSPKPLLDVIGRLRREHLN